MQFEADSGVVESESQKTKLNKKRNMKKKIEKLTEKEKQLLVAAYILSGLKESGIISGASFETNSKARSIVSEMIEGGYQLPVEVLPAAIEALIEHL